jgi:hypothetical protein
MMRLTTFGRGVAFAALAALGWIPWATLSSPFLGGRETLATYLVGSFVLYVAALGDRFRPGSAGAAALVACGACALAGAPSAELAIVLASLLGLFRSGVVYGPASPRALALEVVLLGGGLLFARHLASPSLLDVGLAIWGFFLVQSFYFVRRAGAPAPSDLAAEQDGFEDAYRRAAELLERP